MQSVFVIITKMIASKNYFYKEVFCNNFGRDGNVQNGLVFFLFFSYKQALILREILEEKF